jgi:hypothetical protein
MAVYTANNVVKTLTIHKSTCRVIPKDNMKLCGCGDRGQAGNQRWYCEKHIHTEDVNRFMNGKFWAILFCDICYRADD